MHNKKKTSSTKTTVYRLLSLFKPYKIPFLLIILLTIISTLLWVFTPKLLGNATTSIFHSITQKTPIDFLELKKILLFLAILNGIGGLFSYFSYYMLSSYSQKIIFDLRMEINEKLTRLPLNYYDTTSFGDFISRITNDVDTISTALQQGLTTLITSVVMIVGVLTMMMTIHVGLTLIALVALPSSMFLAKFIIKKSQKYFKEKQAVLGSLNGHVEEVFSSLTTIKAYNKEKDVVKEFSQLNGTLNQKSVKSSFLSSIIMPLTTIISNISYVVISVVGAFLLLKGKIRIGDIQAFLEYTKKIGQPISQVASISSVIQGTLASADRIFDMLDQEEMEENFTQTMPKDIKGDICFHHVKFGYTPDKILMQDMDLHISAGETVAIIGPTGAGKSTMINLLMRFYDVQGGCITVDGVNIQNVDPAEVRRQFGTVLQDTWLFNGTIYDNIAYSNEQATKDDVIRAAKMARAHDFITTQSKGYQTMINEEGSNISVGEKQLITIARAILSNPKILILDEATSSVDTRTEQLIKEGLSNLSKGKTTFMIAHRLSTVKDASKVILMEEGSIAKIGTYESVVLKQETL